MDYLKNNASFWNRYSREGGPWSQRSSKELIEKARSGIVEIFVTTEKKVPQSWLPTSWKNLNILGLAAGGGQQMPIIAAAGANVTTFDISKEQLMRDKEACKDEGLSIETIQGDMQNLDALKNNFFDLIVNPVSNCFVENVEQVWKEAYRVLKPNGVLISGFNNPVAYALDQELYSDGKVLLNNRIPYSDLKSLDQKQLSQKKEGAHAFEFGHSLTQLIGGQLETGFQLTGFYEDNWGPKFKEPLDKILPQFIATRAVK